MDDKPAIEYHPFGTITLNFDEATIKLRRCRLGDLEYAKNLLEELQAVDRDQRQTWVDEIQTIRTDSQTAEYVDPLTDEQREEIRVRLTRLRELTGFLETHRVNIVHGFLSEVAGRMGDNKPPAKEEWPLDFFDANVPTDIIAHWQTRPLASGKSSQNQNGAVAEASSSPPSAVEASSLPVRRSQ